MTRTGSLSFHASLDYVTSSAGHNASLTSSAGHNGKQVLPECQDVVAQVLVRCLGEVAAVLNELAAEGFQLGRGGFKGLLHVAVRV